jgi:ABC-type oligopeptide transport system substrate-binding subunit
MRRVKKAVALALSCAMLSGCGGSSKRDTSTFRFALAADITSMDSTVVDDTVSFDAIHAVTEGLMGQDKDGNTTNAIAKDYKVSADKKTYTFTLRDDAKWSNGDPVTANDFVYAWKRIIKNAGTYGYMFGSDGANIKNADQLVLKGTNATDAELNTLGVKAVNDKTLTVELNAPVPFFTDLMSFPCFYPINEKFAEKAGKKYATAPQYTLSNGAFVMTKWTKGKSADFEKNDDYYNKGVVKIKKLHMDLGIKPQSASANFDAKKIDYAEISTDLVDKYKNSKSFVDYNDGGLGYLEVNHKNKDLANLNIRKAISLAINRKSLCNDILKNGSTPANGFVPKGLSKAPNGKDFREVAGSYTDYNLKEAQAAFDQGLKELGKTNITLGLLYGSDENSSDKMAEYLETNLSKLKGLKIEMKATTFKDKINNRMPQGNFDLVITAWGPDFEDPTTFLNLMNKGNSSNYGKYDNSKYVSLMKNIQTESNVEKRYNYMLEAEKVAMEDYANIPLIDRGGCALKAEYVKGLIHKPVGVAYTFTYVELN